MLNRKEIPSQRKIFVEQEKKKSSFFSSMLTICLLIGAFSAVVSLFLLRGAEGHIPTMAEIASTKPTLASQIYDRNGELVTQLFKENRNWVNLEDISHWMTKAVIAAEDGEFYQHKGVRPLAVVRALIVDFVRSKRKQGGSTITQQVAKNMFLSHEKSITRKVKELIIAARLEKTYTKNQILEMYLNTIYLGHGAYGIDVASRQYFGKAPADLDILEAATIAGLIAAPERFSPYKHPQECLIRSRYVLSRMREMNYITNEDYVKYAGRIPQLAPRRRENSLHMNNAAYFVSHILFKHLLPNFGSDMIYKGGLKIYTTIDKRLQKKAEEIMQRQQYQGALIAIEPATGEIIAMVGGRDFNESKFNRVTQALREPGSAFKPFVYAAAIEKGYRAIDHLIDAPITFKNGWSPKNYEKNKFMGEITMTTAVAKSLNTTAVRMAQITGLNNIIDICRQLGITTDYLPRDLSLALGSASVTPLEMAVAYSVFAANGVRAEPYAIKEIKNNKNQTIEKTGQSLQSVISASTAMQIRSILKQVINRGTGSRASISGHETFGKTGTTNGNSDAWFIGGIPGLVVCVYFGNDNHKSLGAGKTGSNVALPVWKEFVQYAVSINKYDANFPFASSAAVAQAKVCQVTGFLAGQNCRSESILLPMNAIPTSTCPLHGGNKAEAISDKNAPRLLLSSKDKHHVPRDSSLYETNHVKDVKTISDDVPTEQETNHAPEELDYYDMEQSRQDY
ncbi:MAG: PBP1A family penicillin-binding protein [Synergistaceae bacterium]|nr:PBP1A family penicillin-binding protein [Synergistaceae bacterium]